MNPDFSVEENAAIPGAVRLACLLGAGAFLSFAPIDMLLVTDLGLLLVTRVAILSMLALIALVSRRSDAKNSVDLLATATLLTMGLGVVALAAQTGGAESPYHLALVIVMMGYAVVVPWRAKPYAIGNAIVVVTYAVAAWDGDQLTYWVPNVGMLSVSGVVATVGMKRGWDLRHGEWQTRTNLQKAHERLQELDRVKSLFFANLSHELRTPLTLILAPLQTLMDDSEIISPETRHQNATLAWRNAVRLLRDVDDLLELTRLEAGRLDLKLSSFDLRALTEDLVAEVRALAERKLVDVALLDSAAALPVIADRDQIERVVLNLLTNAVKFTRRQGRISVRIRREGVNIRVDVEDNGIGIPPEHLSQIFDRFHQVDNASTRRHRGTGIGLSIAKQLVELHGGRIEVASTLGFGTTVTFRLPLEPPDLRPGTMVVIAEGGLPEWHQAIRRTDMYRLGGMDDATERRVAPRGRDLASAPTVLVVEDNPDMLRFVCGLLAGDYAVLSAQDGRAGLLLARKHNPDLVVTDLMMPEMDGFALVRELRADAQLRDVPVIMLTAKGDPDDRITAGAGGVDLYLTKPFHPTELLHSVRNLLRRTLGIAASSEAHRDTALKTLALGIAHEILNPLGFLQSGAFLLQQAVHRLAERAPQDEATRTIQAQAREAHDAAIEGVERVRTAVEDLRAFAHAGAVEQGPAEPCSLDDVVKRVASLASASGGLTTTLGGTPVVNIRREQMERLLLHLIVNARQAGGAQVKIHLHTWTEHGGVAVSVTDNGPGVPQKLRDQIFSPFFTTRAEGTGLGLSMARQIAWSHGGRLTLGANTEGDGATFVVRIPFEVSTPTPPQTRAEA